MSLPQNYLVVYDYQDGGVMLLDTIASDSTGEFKIYNSAWESIPDDLGKEIIYPNLVDYVKSMIETHSNIIEDEYIECKE